VPTVGLLVESRLVIVPASATPAMSRTPPMIAANLNTIGHSFAVVVSPRLAAREFGAGNGRGGERKALVKSWQAAPLR
jgi:hypothetical protein